MADMEKQAFVPPSLSVEDLTVALYEANRELMRVNRRLHDSEESRREILSNLSHDLRSPLAAIRVYVEYLLSEPPPAAREAERVLLRVQEKVQAMEHLVGEMLEMSGLDAADNSALQYEHLRLVTFLEDFFYDAQADLRYRGFELRLTVPPDFACYVDIDTRLMQRVLDNLFLNALQYSEPPGVITLDACQAEDMVVVSVSDTGIGIAEEDRERIFERTCKVSGARSPNGAYGCGLGLSIVRSVVQRHCGRVWCESTPGKGSTFFFTLPETSGAPPRH